MRVLTSCFHTGWAGMQCLPALLDFWSHCFLLTPVATAQSYHEQVQPTLSHGPMKEPHTNLEGPFLHRCLISSLPVLQIPAALVAPNSDLPVHSSMVLQCRAWALAPSTAVRKLSSEREPGDHRTHLPSLLSLRDHRLVLSIVLSLKTIISYLCPAVYWGRTKDDHPIVYFLC